MCEHVYVEVYVHVECVFSDINPFALKSAHFCALSKTAEVRTFLAIVILMGLNRLPTISNYWSTDCFIGIPNLHHHMSLARFWALWSNLHLVDNQSMPPTGGVCRKVNPLLDALGHTFLTCYSPG